MKKKIINIIDIVILILLAPIIFVSGVILIDLCLHPTEIPSFFGYKPFITVSNSMTPIYEYGDVIITKESNYNNLKVGDIIAYRKNDKVKIHRIQNIEIDENGNKRYTTKGDKSFSEDEGYVSDEEIEGIYLNTYKKVGETLLFIRTPLGMTLCLSIPIILLIYVYVDEYQDTLEKEKEEKNGKH